MDFIRRDKNLLIVALVTVVGALGYGIVIPVLYSYSLKFGLGDFENGVLFALFSLFQFISTPIIGRLSDKYGRRPLLVISIAGTAVSFFMMAFAPSAVFLYIARALDGITAGNIPVASAVISDTTESKDRAKGFGIIGAAFGLGFTFGPAISALTVGISPALPFIIAGVISVVATIVTYFFLSETNKHMGEVKKGRLFDFGKLFHALRDRNVGPTLLITLVFSLAISMFIYAFQPFSVKILNMSANQISLIFTIFGIIGLITQTLLLSRLTDYFGLKRAFTLSLSVVLISLVAMFATRSLPTFIIASVFLALSNSVVNPLIQTILSKETDSKSQGSIMGINTSYMSIGQILGPIVGGAIATLFIPYTFLAAGLTMIVCIFLSLKVFYTDGHRESLF